MDWIELLKYAFPAITALIATGITLYFQYKVKKVELGKSIKVFEKSKTKRYAKIDI